MNALDLLSELSDRGIKIRPDGEHVVVSPDTALTPDLVERIQAEKPALLRELERLRDEAGEDWEAIAADPKQLRAFYELSMIVDMRTNGVAPNHYTSATNCSRCGPVPIWSGCATEVRGCPWCFNRIQGLHIPAVRT